MAKKESKSGMGNLGKVSPKGKEHMKEVPGAMEMKPNYKEPKIFPDEDGKTKNPRIEEDMFSRKALSSDMVSDGTYAAKNSKKIKIDEKTWSYKKTEDESSMWPDGSFAGAKGSNVI